MTASLQPHHFVTVVSCSDRLSNISNTHSQFLRIVANRDLNLGLARPRIIVDIEHTIELAKSLLNFLNRLFQFFKIFFVCKKLELDSDATGPHLWSAELDAIGACDLTCLFSPHTCDVIALDGSFVGFQQFDLHSTNVSTATACIGSHHACSADGPDGPMHNFYNRFALVRQPIVDPHNRIFNLPSRSVRDVRRSSIWKNHFGLEPI